MKYFEAMNISSAGRISLFSEVQQLPGIILDQNC
jgi:hypothetical protein